jgi:cytochrome c oxidase assembly protein subunit 15
VDAGPELIEPENRGLHRFAVFTALATTFLIFAGGLVTSTESGLAVPDWPLSYGMVFPPMPGGIFFEHGHRMVAAFVGLLTVILSVWIWRREPRPWVRRLAAVAMAAVITQGILGGITVLYFLPLAVSLTHAMLAQTFFCIVVSLALVTSRDWKRGLPVAEAREEGLRLPLLCALTTAAIYLQLLLGALMRHTDSGFAIPDFPLAFGRIVPDFDSSGVMFHFAHRMGALLVTIMVAWTLGRILVRYRAYPRLVRPALLLGSLVLVQLTLGAFTIWTRAAVAGVPIEAQPYLTVSVLVTTFHVVTGATILGVATFLTLRAFAMAAPARSLQPQPA